jgi:hypothetical protein
VALPFASSSNYFLTARSRGNPYQIKSETAVYYHFFFFAAEPAQMQEAKAPRPFFRISIPLRSEGLPLANRPAVLPPARRTDPAGAYAAVSVSQDRFSAAWHSIRPSVGAEQA